MRRALIFILGIFLGVFSVASISYAVAAFPYAIGGTGTTTPNIGQLSYWATGNLAGVATTSASCTGLTSCSSFTVIGSSPITITTSSNSSLATSTGESSGQLAYWTSSNATPATLGKVATSSITYSSPFTTSGTAGFIVGGSGFTLGLNTSGAWTGNAGSATVLATARAINGVNFDGSAAITVNAASSTALTDKNTWTGLQTITSASTTNLTAGSELNIPNGASKAPVSAGDLAQDTTDNQLVLGTGGSTAVFDQRRNLSLSYGTSTTWAGTTTLPVFTVPQGMTWNTESCTVQPSGATLNAQAQYANASAYTTVNLTMVPASTTPGVYTFSSNNTPTANATSTISFGTPTGSPTGVTCTLSGTITGT